MEDEQTYWISAGVYSGFVVFFALSWIFYKFKSIERINSGKQAPNFGFSALWIKLWLIRMGFWVCLWMTIFGLLFYPSCSGKLVYLCNSYLNFYQIAFPIIFGIFIMMFLINDTILRGFVGPKIAKVAVKRGDENILIIGNHSRGATAIRVASILNEYGKVTGIDPFDTKEFDEQYGWVQENIRRANLADKITMIRGDARNLSQFEDDSFDVVLVSYAHAVYPEKDWVLVAGECMRKCKADGRVVFMSPVLVGDGVSKKAHELGWKEGTKTYIPFLPFPLRCLEGTPAKSIDAHQIRLMHSVRKFMKPFSVRSDFKFKNENKNMILAVALLLIAIIILWGFVIAEYFTWPYIQVPTDITPYNRVGAGLVSGTIVWTGYGIIESFVEGTESYLEGEYNNAILIKHWSIWFVGSVIAATIWNSVLYVPSLLVDIYFSGNEGLQNTLNILIPVILVFVVFKVGTFVTTWKTNRETKKDMERIAQEMQDENSELLAETTELN